MISTYIYTVEAGPAERFARDAWAGSVGKHVPLLLLDGTIRSAHVTEVNVVDDGRRVEFVFDVDGPPVVDASPFVEIPS